MRGNEACTTLDCMILVKMRYMVTSNSDFCKRFRIRFVHYKKLMCLCFVYYKQGYFDFVQEMVSLMAQTRREVKLISAPKFTDIVLFLLSHVNGWRAGKAI